MEADRVAAVRAGRWLQYGTMAWNAAECGVALAAGFVAGSIALVGFGFDSAIEVTSGLAALWRLWRDPDEARRAKPRPGKRRSVPISRRFFSRASA